MLPMVGNDAGVGVRGHEPLSDEAGATGTNESSEPAGMHCSMFGQRFAAEYSGLLRHHQLVRNLARASRESPIAAATGMLPGMTVSSLQTATAAPVVGTAFANDAVPPVAVARNGDAFGSHAVRPSAQALRLAANPRQPGAYPGSQTQLFMPGRNDVRAIEVEDISQGTGGTCTILAAGMSLANDQRGRMWLTRNLRDDGNGNISVNLWNKPMSITLDKIRSMPTGRGDFNGSSTDPRWEIWPKALEAGYVRGAKWLFDVEFYRTRTVGSPNIEMALRAISGPRYHIAQSSGMTEKQFFRNVGAALNEHKVIIAATVDVNQMTPLQKDLEQSYGLIPNHAYAVLGLNAKDGTVWLGNPHGYTQSVPAAVFLRFFPEVGWGYVP
jgi:Calpain family cysteine protease